MKVKNGCGCLIQASNGRGPQSFYNPKPPNNWPHEAISFAAAATPVLFLMSHLLPDLQYLHMKT